jgi:hypothetical protein
MQTKSVPHLRASDGQSASEIHFAALLALEDEVFASRRPVLNP